MLKASFDLMYRERDGMKYKYGFQEWHCSKLIVLKISIFSTAV